MNDRSRGCGEKRKDVERNSDAFFVFGETGAFPFPRAHSRREAKSMIRYQNSVATPEKITSAAPTC